MNNYPNLPGPMEPRDCLFCQRSFLPNKCPLHCGNGCCRSWGCDNAYRDRNTPRKVAVKCIVCWRPAAQFEAFAPCTKACVGTVYFQSSQADPGTLGGGLFRRRYQSACHLRETFVPEWHKPDKPARVHQKYCSLRCYNSMAFGHETRRLEGQRRRNRRKEGRRGGEQAEPGWRNRWRQEQGYFREQQRMKKLRQENLVRYGDDSSEAELRLREAAQNDPDFLEIFGPGKSTKPFS